MRFQCAHMTAFYGQNAVFCMQKRAYSGHMTAMYGQFARMFGKMYA